jgi:ribosomal protein S27AE
MANNKKSKMICPKCGDEMNHHADKLVYSAGPDGAGHAHADLGGVVEETHACPACGAIESRRAD